MMVPEFGARSLPTYEYLCKKCDQNVEAYQKFTDKPLKKHQGCGGELRKVFHANGVVFKGSGFYATDSRKESSTTTAASNGSSNGKKEDSTKSGSKESVSTSNSSSSKADDSKSSDTKSSDTKGSN